METRKSHNRRASEGWFDRWVKSPVIDIGCGADPIVPECDRWDLQLGHGDATLMNGVGPEVYNTVYSSHCLEHLIDPLAALRRWWEILRPGGHLIVVVPHRNLYEQKRFLPSVNNPDHKHFWLPFHAEPPCTFSLVDALRRAVRGGEIMGVRVLDEPGEGGREFSIEAVVRKAQA